MAAIRSDPDLARAFAGFCFTSAEDVPKAIDRILPEDEQKARKERQLAAAQARAAFVQAEREAKEAAAVED